MQNKTDKGTLLVSKSLPVVNSNSVNRLFSKRKTNRYVSPHDYFKFLYLRHIQTRADRGKPACGFASVCTKIFHHVTVLNRCHM